MVGQKSKQSSGYLQVQELQLPQQLKHEEVIRHDYHLPVEELSPALLLPSHCASPEQET